MEYESVPRKDNPDGAPRDDSNDDNDDSYDRTSRDDSDDRASRDDSYERSLTPEARSMNSELDESYDEDGIGTSSPICLFCPYSYSLTNVSSYSCIVSSSFFVFRSRDEWLFVWNGC